MKGDQKMFGKENQYAMVSGFGVRVKDEREKDRNHIIESNFEVALTHDLADQIMPAMARDLFQEVAGQWEPKPEIQVAGFNLAPETQTMVVREHPELDPLFKTEGVGIRRVQAKKSDGGTWILTFTTSWVMTDAVQATAIIRSLKSGVYLTFAVQAPKLDFEEGQQPQGEGDGQQTATVDQGGNVVAIESGKKKKTRRRGSPEDEAKAQRAEGKKKAEGGGEEETTH